ncbi:uncharacterized protein LOC100119306 [Nasonia vitripennis]|uniref:NADH-ubiquinone oxidoreductase 9 kDa subunit n=1 Tax=Nasonia vitripennis TaxID=7425 RepID=A0A7M7G6E2_NASVI|nr:uncharacterized protein LOC100119306 [Nasonia vitripennis]
MLRVVRTQLISQRSSAILKRNLASGKTSQGSTTHQPKSSSIPEVPGLTNKVVDVPNQAVGYAGAAKDKEYKNPEYFCYHVDSFGESFVEMEKFRLPAPSNKAKK